MGKRLHEFLESRKVEALLHENFYDGAIDSEEYQLMRSFTGEIVKLTFRFPVESGQFFKERTIEDFANEFRQECIELDS